MKRSAPLKRKTPLRDHPSRKRSPTKRRLNPRPRAQCAYGPRCKRPPRVVVSPEERYCATHATAIADKLVGNFVKARDRYRCQLVSFNGKPCYQPEAVYWCHLIPKGRYYATRWEPDNAVTGCAGHHKAFDNAPIERDDWCERRLGPERWQELREIARQQKAVDVAEVIRRFRVTNPPDPARGPDTTGV